MHLGLTIAATYFTLIYSILGVLDLSFQTIAYSLLVASLVYMVLTWQLVFLRPDRYREHSPIKDIFFCSITFICAAIIFVGSVYPYTGTHVLMYGVAIFYFGACHAMIQSAILGIWWRV